MSYSNSSAPVCGGPNWDNNAPHWDQKGPEKGPEKRVEADGQRPLEELASVGIPWGEYAPGALATRRVVLKVTSYDDCPYLLRATGKVFRSGLPKGVPHEIESDLSRRALDVGGDPVRREFIQKRNAQKKELGAPRKLQPGETVKKVKYDEKDLDVDAQIKVKPQLNPEYVREKAILNRRITEYNKNEARSKLWMQVAYVICLVVGFGFFGSASLIPIISESPSWLPWTAVGAMLFSGIVGAQIQKAIKTKKDAGETLRLYRELLDQPNTPSANQPEGINSLKLDPRLRAERHFKMPGPSPELARLLSCTGHATDVIDGKKNHRGIFHSGGSVGLALSYYNIDVDRRIAKAYVAAEYTGGLNRNDSAWRSIKEDIVKAKKKLEEGHEDEFATNLHAGIRKAYALPTPFTESGVGRPEWILLLICEEALLEIGNALFKKSHESISIQAPSLGPTPKTLQEMSKQFKKILKRQKSEDTTDFVGMVSGVQNWENDFNTLEGEELAGSFVGLRFFYNTYVKPMQLRLCQKIQVVKQHNHVAKQENHITHEAEFFTYLKELESKAKAIKPGCEDLERFKALRTELLLSPTLADFEKLHIAESRFEKIYLGIIQEHPTYFLDVGGKTLVLIGRKLSSKLSVEIQHEIKACLNQPQFCQKTFLELMEKHFKVGDLDKNINAYAQALAKYKGQDLADLKKFCINDLDELYNAVHGVALPPATEVTLSQKWAIFKDSLGFNAIPTTPFKRDSEAEEAGFIACEIRVNELIESVGNQMTRHWYVKHLSWIAMTVMAFVEVAYFSNPWIVFGINAAIIGMMPLRLLHERKLEALDKKKNRLRIIEGLIRGPGSNLPPSAHPSFLSSHKSVVDRYGLDGVSLEGIRHNLPLPRSLVHLVAPTLPKALS